MNSIRDLTNVRVRLQNRYRRGMSSLVAGRYTHIDPGGSIISFTFDDFPKSALHAGGSILERYDLAGTYYASFGLMDRDSAVGRIFSAGDLNRVLARHELGCHTFAHCHAWETPPRVFEQSILENREALQRLVPGAVFETLSYPISCPRPGIKRIAGERFLCCRGGGQTFNAGKTDLNNLRAFFLEKVRGNPALVKDLIDRNCRATGWLILATHDICDAPSPFGCSPEFFEDIVRYAVRSGARVLPVIKAWKTIGDSAHV
jgi:peptidoglycan/xylan/chitin deacetylase (PgdA/CDA1 family)